MIPSLPPRMAAADLIATLNDRIRRINEALGGDSTAAGTELLFYGTHAQRLGKPIASFADGALFAETDRDTIYQKENNVWVYVGGVLRATQAAKPSDLGTHDAGLLYWVTDYGHLLEWTGTGWQWGPGEQGSGMLVPFAVAPSGVGWHACDGSAGIAYLKSDGTTATVTLPNTAASAAFMKLGGAYAAAITAATVPTVSQPTFTGNALPTHQHNTPFGVDGSTFNVYSPTATGTAGGNSSIKLAGTNVVQAITSRFATDAVSPGTPSGTVSQPTATLPADPVANFEALLYFRQ